MLRFILIALLFTNISCAKPKDSYGIYIKVSDANYIMTSRALLELQMQSRNTKIQYAGPEDYAIIVVDSDIESLDKMFNGAVLGVAMPGDPCEITMSQRAYNYGQDWVNSVFWHEVGHCVGLEHVPDSNDIMYKYAWPLSSYKEDYKQDFFRRLYDQTH